MKTQLKKLLAKLGFAYCPKCGTNLFFDEDKWNLGYNVRSICPHCTNDRIMDTPEGRYFDTEAGYVVPVKDVLQDDDKRCMCGGDKLPNHDFCKECI